MCLNQTISLFLWDFLFPRSSWASQILKLSRNQFLKFPPRPFAWNTDSQQDSSNIKIMNERVG
ncbi:UNVERIFIED_CONTAM: hypothetical protein FKN15_050327 [Acipenser sinensis]